SAGGQARARGRALLRDRRHGHRFRLLASRPRCGDGAGHYRRAHRQRGEGQSAGGAARPRFPPRARAPSPPFGPPARPRADRRAGSARQEAFEEARRGGGTGAEDEAEALRTNPVNQLIPPSSCESGDDNVENDVSNGLHGAAVVWPAIRFSIVRAATVPLAIAVAMHGCAGLETSPTANTPRQDVSMLPSITR